MHNNFFFFSLNQRIKKYVTIIFYISQVEFLTHLCVFSAFFRKQITSKEEKSHKYELKEIFWQVGQEIFTLVERVVVSKYSVQRADSSLKIIRRKNTAISSNEKKSRGFDIFFPLHTSGHLRAGHSSKIRNLCFIYNNKK